MTSWQDFLQFKKRVPSQLISYTIITNITKILTLPSNLQLNLNFADLLVLDLINLKKALNILVYKSVLLKHKNLGIKHLHKGVGKMSRLDDQLLEHPKLVSKA